MTPYLDTKKMTCTICNQERQCRSGVCFDCAEAESIIQEGVDMYNDGPDHLNRRPALKSMDRLKFLIQKGWNISSKKSLLDELVIAADDAELASNKTRIWVFIYGVVSGAALISLIDTLFF